MRQRENAQLACPPLVKSTFDHTSPGSPYGDDASVA
jgi:hypothetical protein